MRAGNAGGHNGPPECHVTAATRSALTCNARLVFAISTTFGWASAILCYKMRNVGGVAMDMVVYTVVGLTCWTTFCTYFYLHPEHEIPTTFMDSLNAIVMWAAIVFIIALGRVFPGEGRPRRPPPAEKGARYRTHPFIPTCAPLARVHPCRCAGSRWEAAGAMRDEGPAGGCTPPALLGAGGGETDLCDTALPTAPLVDPSPTKTTCPSPPVRSFSRHSAAASDVASRRSAASHAVSTMTRGELEGMHRASFGSCAANLTNSIVGAGILGLPKALGDCGYALPGWCWIADVAVVVNCFGNGCTYLIVIADMMPKVMEQLGAGGVTRNRHAWVLPHTTPALPRLDSLRFTSTMSVVFISFVAALIVLYHPKRSSWHCIVGGYACGVAGLDPCDDVAGTCRGETSVVHTDATALKAVTVFIFCFVCHQARNVFTVCNEIRDPSPRRYDGVIVAAEGGALCVYIAVAVAAYYTYGARIESDMLNTYGARIESDMLNTYGARIESDMLNTYGARIESDMLNTYGSRIESDMLNTYGARIESDMLNTYGARIESDMLNTYPVTGVVTAARCCVALLQWELVAEVRYWTATVAFLGGPRLGAALAVVGGTASTLVCYILPGVCYARLFPHPHAKRSAAFVLS
eukprot:gene22553-61818_t